MGLGDFAGEAEADAEDFALAGAAGVGAAEDGVAVLVREGAADFAAVVIAGDGVVEEVMHGAGEEDGGGLHADVRGDVCPQGGRGR